jgi:hypothetical protein
MALSPQYGWAEPDNSSLVKNGAADIRTLGDAIDTSVWNVGYGQAGKNKIQNADFSVNQRNLTSTTTSSAFMFDRWRTIYTGGTTTSSSQTFTPGTAPVAGYEGKNYLRIVTTSQSAVSDFARFQQNIEGVRTFAGQNTTVSFWAKAASGTPKVAAAIVQTFGSGGGESASVETLVGTVTLSTSWVRYTINVAVPSIAGKTFGPSINDDVLSLRLFTSGGSSVTSAQSIGLQNNTFDFWGVQWEYGSKATPFQTASGGSLTGELAMCQRYYWRNTNDAGTDVWLTAGLAATTTLIYFGLQFPVKMRAIPTSIDYASPRFTNALAAYTGGTLSLAGSATSTTSTTIIYTHGSAALTLNNYYMAQTQASGYIGLSAEL